MLLNCRLWCIARMTLAMSRRPARRPYQVNRNAAVAVRVVALSSSPGARRTPAVGRSTASRIISPADIPGTDDGDGSGYSSASWWHSGLGYSALQHILADLYSDNCCGTPECHQSWRWPMCAASELSCRVANGLGAAVTVGC